MSTVSSYFCDDLFLLTSSDSDKNSPVFLSLLVPVLIKESKRRIWFDISTYPQVWISLFITLVSVLLGKSLS